MYLKDTGAQVVPRLSAILAGLEEHSADEGNSLRKRQYGYGYGYGYGYSGWSGYGRWILLGVIVGLAILIYLLVCCCNRRRTRSGMQPVKYTGWATPYSHPQQTGVVDNHQNNYAAPQTYPETQQYPQTQQYPMQTYPQEQNYGNYNSAYQPPITGHNAPPSYPADQPIYPAPVAGREK